MREIAQQASCNLKLVLYPARGHLDFDQSCLYWSSRRHRVYHRLSEVKELQTRLKHPQVDWTSPDLRAKHESDERSENLLPHLLVPKAPGSNKLKNSKFSFFWSANYQLHIWSIPQSAGRCQHNNWDWRINEAFLQPKELYPSHDSTNLLHPWARS